MIAILLTVLLAATQPIELETKKLLDGKMEMLVPKGFTYMHPDTIRLKYPGQNRPKLVLTNEAMTVNLAFGLTDVELEADEIDEEVLEGMKEMYEEQVDSLVWRSSGLKKINGKPAVFLQFITQALDTKIYNHLILTELGGKLLITTFNCLIADEKLWKPVAEQMMNSIKMK